MNAIVALTRGYRDLDKYDSLLIRNMRIKKFINHHNKYPLILFHEGNIPQDHRNYIVQGSGGQTVIFVDVSEIWQGGYEAMCQFQTYHIWNYCKEYDYVLRVDEDCHITQCLVDPFDLVGGNVFMKSVDFAESHSETNATLPYKIMEMCGQKDDWFYDHKFPYTNVSLSKVSFWLDKPMNDYLYLIAMCPDQRKNRWGDLPVLGSLLNIYAKGRVGALSGLSYEHLSHHNIIESK